jgi:hypothetical protein
LKRSYAIALSALLLVLVAVAIAGCGGSDSANPAELSSPVRAQAEANCRQVRREVVRFGRRAFANSTNLAEEATERVIKPSIPLLERFARRQQEALGGSGDPNAKLYLRLFDPLVALAYERLHSGEESGDSPFNTAARGFEILTGTVADEQRQAAREAGLPDCAIDFEQVLTSALRG